MTLVRIQAGSFLMGSTKDQIDQLMRMFPDSQREWFDAEQAQHMVKITRPFYLGSHPVTQGQYQAVMGSNPSSFKGSADLPVEYVSWFDAIAFCNKLSEKENRMPCYRTDNAAVRFFQGNDGYRLPTEAEWEYACRAGSSTRYPFGDDTGGLGEYTWYAKNSASKTHAIGQKKSNVWGLYEMLGNVWEWCADGYDANYYASSPPAGPLGAAGASWRVIRGGGWDCDSRDCRSASQFGRPPGERRVNIGFRVALVQSGG